MIKNFKIILTIIIFLFSIYYTNKIIEYFQYKDPLMQEIIDKQDNYYQEPIDAVITKNIVIPEINGKKINIKKSYKKMKRIGSFNENLLVYEKVLPKKSYLNNYDKIIIPKLQNNKLSLIFEINNNQLLFNNISQILKENDITASVLNSDFDIKNTNYKHILSTSYNKNIDYCLSFNLTINKECQNNKKYTLLSKESIIYNNFLNNTKKAIDNQSNIVIYRFNNDNLNNLNSIIKYLRINNVVIINLSKLF